MNYVAITGQQEQVLQESRHINTIRGQKLMQLMDAKSANNELTLFPSFTNSISLIIATTYPTN